MSGTDIISKSASPSGTPGGSPIRYTELTPTTMVNSDNEITDVKIPYISTQMSENDIPNAQQPPVSQEENYPTPSENEINQLLVLFRGLPRDMFINRILVNYASCEVKLENARVNILERLKEVEVYPYAVQCELKRRLHTRTGESVPTKLAQDIHTLLSVLDGGDYGDIKDLLSNGKLQRSYSVTATPLRSTRMNEHAAEIELLTQTVNNLKSEILYLKQTQIGTEEVRTHQIQTLKSSIVALKTDMNVLSSSVSKHLTEIKLGIERIESDRCTGIVQMKSELRTLKESVKDMQDIYDRRVYSTSKGKTDKTLKPQKRMKVNSTAINRTETVDQCNSEQTEVESNEQVLLSAVPSHDSANNAEQSDMQYIPGNHDEVQNSMSDNRNEQINMQPISSMNEQAEVSMSGTPGRAPVMLNVCNSAADAVNAPRESGSHSSVVGSTYAGVVQAAVQKSLAGRGHDPEPEALANVEERNRSNNHVWFQADSSYISCSGSVSHRSQSINRSDGVNEDQGRQPATRERQLNSDDDLYAYVYDTAGIRNNDADDDDFTGCIKKRARRFYLGGFNSNVTRNKIYNFVNKRGPTVTWVRIWQSRRNFDEAVVRLNVVDDSNAGLLLDSEFWPAGVICRPWKSKSERLSASNGSRYRSSRKGYSSRWARPTFGRSDVDEYNPFSPLRDPLNTDL